MPSVFGAIGEVAGGAAGGAEPGRAFWITVTVR